MTKILKDLIDEGVLKNVETFSKKTESEMLFNSSLTGDSLDFEWVDVVTNALPYLDNIIRNPNYKDKHHNKASNELIVEGQQVARRR